MKHLITFLLMAGLASTGTSQNHAAEVESLLKKMTIEEKIGQLNLVTGGEALTGSAVSKDVESKLSSGRIGGIFSLSTPEKTRKAQELALKSRLKIPIIFGFVLYNKKNNINS
mgnify:CR=1 FL=1